MPADRFDVVGDVHGKLNTVRELVRELGYRRSGPHPGSGQAWSHPQGRRLVFVGDLVDEGPDPLGCLEFVQELQTAGVATWVLGNHELNLLHLIGGQRPDNPRTRGQAARTLDQVEPDPERFERLRPFLLDAPLFLELDEGRLRVVHACWDSAAISRLPPRLGEEGALERTGPEGELSDAVETCLKGPEEDCEPFEDRFKNIRRHRRRHWWKRYPPDAPLVVFGHYRFPLEGTPREPALLGPGHNAACVDHEGRKLVALRYPERVFLAVEGREA